MSDNDLLTLASDLRAASAALDAIDARLPPQPPTPPLLVLSTPALFAPAFAGDERLLSFATPDLHASFFGGFEQDNVDIDEDNKTPDDAIAEHCTRTLSHVDAVWRHIARTPMLRRPAHETNKPAPGPPPPLPPPPPLGAFRFT